MSYQFTGCSTTNQHDLSILVDGAQQQAVKDPAMKENEKNQQGCILKNLTTSVAKVLGITALVKALDKAKKSLDEKQNRNNKYCHDKYKNTVACVQTQVLADPKSLT